MAKAIITTAKHRNTWLWLKSSIAFYPGENKIQPERKWKAVINCPNVVSRKRNPILHLAFQIHGPPNSYKAFILLTLPVPRLLRDALIKAVRLKPGPPARIAGKKTPRMASIPVSFSAEYLKRHILHRRKGKDLHHSQYLIRKNGSGITPPDKNVVIAVTMIFYPSPRYYVKSETYISMAKATTTPRARTTWI